ncbi:midnolin-A-like [Periplaneta americana]|uniref:midnolin-A-like n=1 Tax=Periplaneta americana TaxID=6978 RepID=UPI0037E72849
MDTGGGNAGSSDAKSSPNSTSETSQHSGCGCASGTTITVRVTPTTGGQFDLQVAKTESVENLKKLISKKLKVPKERICLLHRDRQLRDGTLQENQLMDGSRLTLLPSVETGLLAQRPEQSVMQALESLNDSQVNDFLSGKAPLNLTMRLGDHMMLIQLQLSTVTPSSSRRSTATILPSEPSSTQTCSKASTSTSSSPSSSSTSSSPSSTPSSSSSSSSTSTTTTTTSSSSTSSSSTSSPSSNTTTTTTTAAATTTTTTTTSTSSSSSSSSSSAPSPLLVSSRNTVSGSHHPQPSSSKSSSSGSKFSSSSSRPFTSLNPPEAASHHTCPSLAACKCEPAKPTLDTRALAEASRNLTQTLKQLSSEVLTSRSDPAEDSARARRQGAIIESMHHHGKGVYSGTFSGTLNPALQDRFGRPKRDISTIIHILNDLLCATPQYRRHARQGHTITVEASSGSPTKSSSASTNSSNVAATDSRTGHAIDFMEESVTLSRENQATRGKMEQLRLIMEERRARRRARREARSAPYTVTQWSAKSESLTTQQNSATGGASLGAHGDEPMDTTGSAAGEQHVCELNPPEPVVA